MDQVNLEPKWSPAREAILVVLLPLLVGVSVTVLFAQYGHDAPTTACDPVDQQTSVGQFEKADEAINAILGSPVDREVRECVLESMALLGDARCDVHDRLDPTADADQIAVLRRELAAMSHLPGGCAGAGQDARALSQDQVGSGNPASKDLREEIISGANRLIDDLGFDFTFGASSQALTLVVIVLAYAGWVRFVRREDPGVVHIEGIAGLDGKPDTRVEHSFRRHLSKVGTDTGLELAAVGDVDGEEPVALDLSKLAPTTSTLVTTLTQLARQRPEYRVSGTAIDDDRISVEMRGAQAMSPSTFGIPQTGREIAGVQAAHRVHREIVVRLRDNAALRTELSEMDLQRLDLKNSRVVAQLITRGDVW